MAKEDEIIDSKEAAKRLGISLRRVQQLVSSGRLPHQKLGGNIIVRVADLKLVKDRKPGRPKSNKKK